MRSTGEHLPRLLALVPYLMAHPGARVGDVAELFDVSEKQLRADLDLLWLCGLPGHGPGDLIDVSWTDDRITLTNADTIARPLRLATDEALALIVALRALAEVPGLSERAALDSALAKLETAAGEAGRASDRVSVVLESQEIALATARRGIEEGRRLRLVYHVAARDETTERQVDPVRVLLVEGRGYLEAWCRRADGMRLFRLDRVVDIALLDTPVDLPPEATPRDVNEGLFQPSPDDLAVTLDLTSRARWVADYYPYDELVERPDGGCRVTLRTADPGWIVRLALRLGRDATVVAPAQVAASVRSAAAAALAAYDQAEPGPRPAQH